MKRPLSSDVRADQTVQDRADADGRRPGEIDIGLLMAILLRQWWLIGCISAVFIGAGFVYATLAPKIWESTAHVLLDPRDKQITGSSLSQPFQGVDTVWVDTQANVAKSAAILGAVIDKLTLEQDPEFGGAREKTLRTLGAQTLVQRADQTYVLDIAVRSLDADRAARIAQAIAEAFVANQIEVKEAAAREASTLINRQLDELRAKARTAQEKLETYKRDHGILTANGRSVDEDTLRQLNDAYVAARVRTQDAKARRDKLAAARSGATDSALNTIESAVLSRLKIERALAARTVSELSQDLGPNHPRMVAARSDLARADAQIIDELKALSANAETEYQVTSATEAASRRALDDASAVVTDTGERTIELRELENEASLRADMYKTYVARTEEIALQINTQVSDSRVIVPADVPLYPYAPRKTIILALAAIAGLGLALSIAIYRGGRYLPAYDRPDTRRIEPLPLAKPALDVVTAADTDGPALPAQRPQARRDEPVEDVMAELTRRLRSTAGDARPAAAANDALAADAGGSDTEIATVGVPPVLAELTIATSSIQRNRQGRPIARSARAILASAIATGDEASAPVTTDAFERLVHKIKVGAGSSRLVLVLGADDGPAAAAVSFGLAHAPTPGGVLLIDASWDDLPLARAFVDETMPGVIDVISGSADATAVALCESTPDITLVGIGRDDQATEIAANVGRIADFVAKLSGDFGRVVIHCGHRHAPELFGALIGQVDAALIVADAIVEDDGTAAAMVRDLASAIPAYTGLVLVTERSAQRPAAAETM